MKEYSANYAGVVIQNNDPEMRGRVKVFIPNVSSNIHESWDADTVDKIFNFVDNSDVDSIIEDLKSVLPWAEYAGPIFGGCASARYNATLKKGVVSDTNSFDGDKEVEGYRPLNMYTNELAYPDAFSATGKVGNNSVNPYAFQYIPSNYSNLAKGMFSIPNVGAHIWVWFMGGDSNYPVYFASAYGQEDFKRIYTMSQKVGLEGKEATAIDYPASYENKNQEELNHDAKTFRSKHVINSNKNSIELGDTDGLEKIKITQFSGSFLELNNQATIKLSTANDQTMVLGDTFETFQKDKNEFIGGASDVIVHGDSYEKIGNQNAVSVQKIFETYQPIHDLKSLFDVNRTNAANSNDPAFKFNVTSPSQKKEGDYAICPVCKGIPYTQKQWDLIPLHNRILLPIPIPYPGFEGLSMFTPVVGPRLEINGKVGFVRGRYCPLCNRSQKAYTYEQGHQLGKSPSTVNGTWTQNEEKLPDGQLGDLYKSYSPQILDLQNNLGAGGDKINNISRNFVMNVGLVMNDLKSYRVDARGKLKSSGVFVAPEGAILKPEPTPHVEHVDVDALPGGDFVVTAGNKMKFLVGSNGINIKTFGPIEMYGTITNLTSEQMNILAKHELFIDGGEKLTLRGNNISINPFDGKPVLVDGGLHVSGNSIIKGGMHVEGELGVQHITGPAQWYKTEPSGGVTLLVNTLPNIPTAPPIPPHVHPIIISIPDHQHYFLNLPMDLKLAKEEARDAMIQLGINDTPPITAKPIQYPNPASGEIDSTKPLGGVMSQANAAASLAASNIPSEAINSIFDTIGSANDTSGFDKIYESFTTNGDQITESLLDQLKTYDEDIKDSVEKIESSVENIFAV